MLENKFWELNFRGFSHLKFEIFSAGRTPGPPAFGFGDHQFLSISNTAERLVHFCQVLERNIRLVRSGYFFIHFPIRIFFFIWIAAGSTSDSHPLRCKPIWIKIYLTLYLSDSHPLSVNLALFSNLITRRERERERGGGGGGSEIEQNLPLAWTSFSVAFPTICMQRRDKRDSNVSRSANQRRVTKRTVAYRPAVSIRLSRSLGFPTCLFLASPERPHERRPMASRKEEFFSLLFVAWTTQPLHTKLFVGFRRAKFTQRNTNCQKNIFCGRSTPGSPPVGLKNEHSPCHPNLTEILDLPLMYGCARARARVCVCHNEKRVPDEWQARQATQAILQVSSSKHNAKKITTRVRGPFHQSITAILTEEKREEKQFTKPTHVAVYLFRDLDRDRSRL